MRREFSTATKVYASLGPDSHHLALLGSLPLSAALWLCRHETPRAARQACVAAGDDAPVSDGQWASCVADWNQIFAPEPGDQCYGLCGWRWFGLAIVGNSPQMHVQISVPLREAGCATVYVDEEALAPEAKACALAAYEALLPLVRPGGDR